MQTVVCEEKPPSTSGKGSSCLHWWSPGNWFPYIGGHLEMGATYTGSEFEEYPKNVLYIGDQ